jgi:hypothetical protein
VGPSVMWPKGLFAIFLMRPIQNFHRMCLDED